MLSQVVGPHALVYSVKLLVPSDTSTVAWKWILVWYVTCTNATQPTSQQGSEAPRAVDCGGLGGLRRLCRAIEGSGTAERLKESCSWELTWACV